MHQRALLQMLNLFFQRSQNEKYQQPSSETFIKVSNNLDSHYYIVERVKKGDSQYLLQNYFLDNHPQVVKYYTSWKEVEAIQQQVPIVKKPKDKRGIMNALISKKSKAQTVQNKPASKQIEQVKIKTIIEEVLYVQLECFSQAKLPTSLQDIKQFMGLIYLLASKVFQQFKAWPKMIPVMTESKKYKFIKKGKSINSELTALFQMCKRNSKPNLLQEWSQHTYLKLIEKPEQQKQLVLGEFLQKQMNDVISREHYVKLKQGQQYIPQTILMISPLKLVLKELSLTLLVEEFTISYYHHDKQIRQIIMQHNFENTLTIQGHRSNFVIQYLKQFVQSS